MKWSKLKSVFLTTWLIAGILTGSVTANHETLRENVNNDFHYSVLTDGTAMINEYTGSLAQCIIPNNLDGYTVVGIGKAAFQNKRFLQSVTIPDSVEWIGAEAFKDCYNLKSVSFGMGLREIGSLAFYSDYTLKEAILPDSMETIKQQAFQYCHHLQTVNLGEGLQTLGIAAFASCFRLKEITIPASITVIPDSAFMYCYQLKRVTLPDEIITIGSNAFMDCVCLNTDHLPASLEIIDWNAFEECFSLREIQMPASLQEIKQGAFANCSSRLTFITKKGSYVGQYAEGTFAVRYTDTGETIPMPNAVRHDIFCIIQFLANTVFYQFPGILISKLVRMITP